MEVDGEEEEAASGGLTEAQRLIEFIWTELFCGKMI